jgi:hypothetical protein
MFGYAENAAATCTIQSGCMALLNGKYELLGIEDVEAFTAGIIHRSRLDLSYHDREELHVFLIEECWKLSLRYKPGIIRQGFSTWARLALSRRVIDWQRSRFGRTRWQFGGHTYERPRVDLVSLDDDDPEHGSVGATVAGGSLERDASGFAADMRALEARGRRPGQRDDWLGSEAAD